MRALLRKALRISALLLLLVPDLSDGFLLGATRNRSQQEQYHAKNLVDNWISSDNSLRHIFFANRREYVVDVITCASNKKDTTFSADESPTEGIRLNKVFKATHSRREADALIVSGRVSVNGEPVHERGGFKVIPFVDEIALDGKLVTGWEAMNGIAAVQDDKQNKNSAATELKKTQIDKTSVADGPHNKDSSFMKVSRPNLVTDTFEYIKYWKPSGITCTTDQTIPSNIVDDLLQKRNYQPRHRVYPVGRLDKDTSGLILLTSDGRLPNSALRGKFKQPKQYHVEVDRPLLNRDVQRLRDGVVITTVAQRDGANRRKALTAPTLPCIVERLPGTKQRGVAMTLVEGRNRQIRKMMGALGYNVVTLHRVEFMGLTLDPLCQAGEWVELNEIEMKVVQSVLLQARAESPRELAS